MPQVSKVIVGRCVVGAASGVRRRRWCRSPRRCVLPLVPGYLLMGPARRPRPVQRGGRAAGAAAAASVGAVHPGVLRRLHPPGGLRRNTLSSWLRSDAGQRTAGVFVARSACSCWLTRFVPPALAVPRGRPLLSGFARSAGAFPLGMAFAVGWTPCIGPVLGAILDAGRGAAERRAGQLLLVRALTRPGHSFLLNGRA